MEETLSFRPGFGRALTVVIAIVAVVALVTTAVNSGFVAFMRGLGPGLLIPAVVWALFWRPSVDVGDDGVTLRNILRTITVPWPAVAWIDTKYALTIGTADDRKYTAWAAPAPGFVTARRSSRKDREYLPQSTYAEGSIRPGDLASSLSGQAAFVIRQHLERRVMDGTHDHGESSSSARLQAHWHWDVVAVVGALTVWTAVVLLT